MVLQQAAEVFNVAARARLGEAVVGEWYCAGRDSAEQLQDLNVAFPGEDAFGAVHAAEHFEQGFHRARIGGMVHQDFA